MSLRTLGLDQLHLMYSSQSLGLSIITTADIRWPFSHLSSLVDSDALQALTSGEIWLSRGIACRIDIHISFNDKPLDRNNRNQVVERLGYHIRNAKIWSQLSLSAALEISQLFDQSPPQSDISIRINVATRPREFDADALCAQIIPLESKAPESVLSARFERLQIHFKFHSIRKKQLLPSLFKKAKYSPREPESADVMLLDSPSTMEDGKIINSRQKLEGPGGRISNRYSKSIAICSETHKTHNNRYEPNLLDQTLFSSSGLSRQRSSVYGNLLALKSRQSEINGEQKTEVQRLNLSTQLTDVLRKWMHTRPFPSYPTTNDSEQLMKQTAMQNGEINDQLTTPCHQSSSTMGPSDDGDNIIFEVDGGILSNEQLEPDEFNMLLSQPDEAMATTLTSLAAETSPTSTGSTTTPLKRLSPLQICNSDPPDTPSSLEISPACKLAEVAMRILIGGYRGRGQKGMCGVQIKKPPPETSLSKIAPAIFCPGFSEAMSQNARFLPTISHAMSSMSRNAHSSRLRQKLTQLANSPASSFADRDEDRTSESRPTSCLVDVVQARLWTMLHRKLHDPLAAGRLLQRSWSQSNLEVTDGVGEEGRLGEGGVEISSKDMISNSRHEFMVEDVIVDEDESFFNNLLAEEDCWDESGLLENLEEMEHAIVERETDEMLFGDVCWGDMDEAEDLFLQDASMLL